MACPDRNTKVTLEDGSQKTLEEVAMGGNLAQLTGLISLGKVFAFGVSDRELVAALEQVAGGTDPACKTAPSKGGTAPPGT